MYFAQSETPVNDAPQKGNNQPHLVMITHNEYEQYFIEIEQKLYMECTDVATALFNLLGCHYMLNLSYNKKLADVMGFIQEKIAQIPSDEAVKWKSAVSATHNIGISSEYKVLTRNEDKEIESSDSDD